MHLSADNWNVCFSIINNKSWLKKKILNFTREHWKDNEPRASDGHSTFVKSELCSRNKSDWFFLSTAVDT